MTPLCTRRLLLRELQQADLPAVATCAMPTRWRKFLPQKSRAWTHWKR